MALSQFFRILRARIGLFLLILLLSLAAGITGTMLWPKKYTATTHVLVDLKLNDPVTGVPSGLHGAASYLATEIDVIRSQRVATRVVDGLKLVQNPELRQQHARSETSTPIREWVADLLIDQLKVKPSRDSSVLAISFAGLEPKFSAAVANAFAKAYIETNLDLRVDPARQQSAWYDERAAKIRADLDAAQTRLGEYQRETRIVSLDERLDVESARLQELSSQLVALQTLSSEADRRAAIAARAAKAGTNSLSELPEVQQSSLLQSMKAELSRLEGRRSDIRANLGANHPDNLKLTEEIESLRQRIDREMVNVTQALNRTSELNRQRASDLRESLEAQRAKVLQLKSKRDQFTVLTRDVEASQRAFDEVAQRSSKIGLESQLRQTNVSILDPAVAPAKPSSPLMIANLIASAVLGTLAALAAVLAAELPNRRIHSAVDAIEIAGLPVLGQIGNRRRLFARKPVPALARY
jgi:chain length determinant protein EpsF